VDTKHVKPVFVEKIFGPLFYYLNKAVKEEIKDFEKKTGKKVNYGKKTEN